MIILFACVPLFAHASDEYGVSLQRAENLLRQSPVYGDLAFFMGQARRLQGLPPLEMDPAPIFQRRERTGMEPEFALWQMRNADITQGVPGLRMSFPDVGFNPVHADALMRAGNSVKDVFGTQSEQVVEIMSAGAGCQAGFSVSTLGPPAYEYVVTHQLFAVFWAYWRGCITAEAYRMRGGLYATRIYNELLATQTNPISDLQAERMALLCLFGFCKAIPSELIKRLRAEQEFDGLWRFTDQISPAMINHEHGAFLAYFVLVARGDWR